VLLSFVPTVGTVLGLIGFVMILAAIKYIADDLSDRTIFNNMIIAVILGIVGIAIGSLVVLGTVLSAFASGYFTGPVLAPSTSVTTAQWIAFGTAIGLGLLGAWALLLVSAVFLRRSYKTIGTKMGVNRFGTAGTLYLVGAATTIIFVGFVILLAAEIMTAIAFWSIQEPKEQMQKTIVSSAPRQ